MVSNNCLFDHETCSYRAIKPGMVYYDDFVQEYYLILDNFYDRNRRMCWRLLALSTGKETKQLERMIVEDPDVEWI